MTPHERSLLRDHILASGISGDTRTSRENSVSNAIKLADGDPDKALGLGPRGRDAGEVLAAVAALCGCSDLLDQTDGPGVIDPDRTLDALHAMGDRLAQAARLRERMLIATGHPTGLLSMYQAVARALVKEGARVETPLEDERLETPKPYRRRRTVRYLDGVAVLNAGADLVHTHESWPMDRLLDAIGPPDLVLADHGWAGAAIARGIETLCFNDVNDPAIAVAKADGLVDVVVPCDDNLPPGVYDPLRDYLVRRIQAA